MHDLLGAMGQRIAHDECSKGNRIPSRIWRYEDFRGVLLDRERQQEVKGIVLPFSEGEKVGPIESNDFKGFKNLRILIVQNVDVGPKKSLQLPRELRWLQLWGCSAHTIKFDPYSKLVGLDLKNSKTRKIKERTGFKEREHLFDCLGIKGFEELKYVNLSQCHSLVTLPNFSKSLKLEYLKLSCCSSLATLDEAIGALENLVLLEIEFCYNLKNFPSSLRLKQLQTLSFSGCNKVYKLPAMKEELTFLENLNLSFTSFKELPDSIGDLVALKELALFRCKELTTIPRSIYKLRALKKLRITECMKLLRFPRRPAGEATDIFGFPNLECLIMDDCKLKDVEFLNDLTCFQTLLSLDLSGSEFDHIPTCISKFHNLEGMYLRHCKKLFEISELPNVSKLLLHGCLSLKTLPCLHTFICQTLRHYQVDLSDCHVLDKGYIHGSLSLEKVRGFVGSADVLLRGKKFPHWVNFRSKEWVSRYRVCVPGNISEDDILGLALFVSFDRRPPHGECFRPYSKTVMVGGRPHKMDWENGTNIDVLTWFMYIPCQPVTSTSMKVLDWRNLTLEFPDIKRMRRWGMRLLCKREEDDHRVQVQVQINIKQG